MPMELLARVVTPACTEPSEPPASRPVVDSQVHAPFLNHPISGISGSVGVEIQGLGSKCVGHF